MNFIEKIIDDNRLNDFETLLQHSHSKTKLITPIKNSITPVEMVIRNCNYEMTNLLGKYGFFSLTKFDFITFTILNDNINENEKLRFLQLFKYYDVKMNKTFIANSKYNLNTRREFKLLEYCIERDYLLIFSWLLKVKSPKSNNLGFTCLEFSFLGESEKIFNAILNNNTNIRINTSIKKNFLSSTNSLLHNFVNWLCFISINNKNHYHDKILINKFNTLHSNNINLTQTNDNLDTILHIIAKCHVKISPIPECKQFFQQLIELTIKIMKYTSIDILLKNKDNNSAIDIINSTKFENKFIHKIIINSFSNNNNNN